MKSPELPENRSGTVLGDNELVPSGGQENVAGLYSSVKTAPISGTVCVGGTRQDAKVVVAKFDNIDTSSAAGKLTVYETHGGIAVIMYALWKA